MPGHASLFCSGHARLPCLGPSVEGNFPSFLCPGVKLHFRPIKSPLRGGYCVDFQMEMGRVVLTWVLLPTVCPCSVNFRTSSGWPGKMRLLVSDLILFRFL
jgi:hypothetical protein